MSAVKAFELPSPDELTRASAELSREVALLCDIGGELLWADERAFRMFAFELGVDLMDFMASNSRTKYQEFLNKAAAGKIERWELAMRSRTGPVVFECTGSPWNSSILIVASRLPEDHGSSLNEMSMLVSELSSLQRESSRQKAELQRLLLSLESAHALIEREREILETIVGQLPSGVLVVDRSMNKPIIANAALEEMLGKLPDELYGLSSRFIFTDPEGRQISPEEWPVYRSLANGESIEDEELQIVRADGERRIIQISSVPIRRTEGESQLAVAVFHDITRLKELQQQLRHDSLHDPLTGLPNRKLFGLRLKELLAQIDDRSTQVAVLFVDLDGFKQVNDELGHHIGDRVLIETGRRLRDAIRAEDFVARLAGDEFVVFLDSVEGRDVAADAARRILASFEQPFEIEEHLIDCAMSIGIVLSEGGTIDPDGLIKRADSAMYVAKGRGKGQYSFVEADSADLLK